MSLLDQQFESWGHLQMWLSQFEVSVPKQRGRLRKESEEIFVLHHALAAIPDPSLEGTLSISKSERPDFILSGGNSSIGIEVSEVTTPALSRFREASKSREGGIASTSRFVRDLENEDRLAKSSKEVFAKAVDDAFDSNTWGPPWFGDACEEALAKAICQTVDKKAGRRYDTTNYGAFWLAMYDNLGLPCVDTELALDFTRSFLRPKSNAIPFQIVLVSDHRAWLV